MWTHFQSLGLPLKRFLCHSFTPAGCDVPEVIGNLSMSLLSETEKVTCLYYFLTHPRLHSTAVFRVSNDIATIA